MTTLYDNAVPIVNLPFLYINGAVLSNDATTPNSVLNLSAGIMRDSTNTYDLNIGNYNGQVNQSATPNVVTKINVAVNGLNGLDTGAVAASTVYNIFVVADPVSGNPSGAIISVGAPSVGPLMPFGYSAFRHVGYAVTDSSKNFLLFYISGNNNARIFTFDAPQATSVTAGTSATYVEIDLTALVPAVDQLPVRFQINWTANAAADVFNMQGCNSTGDAWTVIAPVAGSTAHTVAYGQVLSQLDAGVPEVNYKVSAVGGVAIDVAGFNFYI